MPPGSVVDLSDGRFRVWARWQYMLVFKLWIEVAIVPMVEFVPIKYSNINKWVGRKRYINLRAASIFSLYHHCGCTALPKGFLAVCFYTSLLKLKCIISVPHFVKHSFSAWKMQGASQTYTFVQATQTNALQFGVTWGKKLHTSSFYLFSFSSGCLTLKWLNAGILLTWCFCRECQGY